MTSLDELIGDSDRMRALKADLERVLMLTRGARKLPPILIQGETGTGKGLIAQLLHRGGARSAGPFVSLNCAAMPESLIESELFGYEPGAFTDAKRRKPGLFQAANRGILFLDEVGLLSQGVQAKLLTAIEDRRIRRLGATVSENTDVWVVTATNLNLAEEVRAGRFREDLYHRLAVLALRLPSLRDRRSDILVLARHFLARVCADYGLPARHLLPEAEAKLSAYAWPGNVRELGNIIERAALMTTETSIGAAPLELADPNPVAEPLPVVLSPTRRVEQAMRDELVAALEATEWNITQTAARLGITRNTVRSRLARFGLGRSVPGSPAPAAAPAVATPIVADEAEAMPVTSTSTGRLLEWERRRVVLLRAKLTDDNVDSHTVGTALESMVEKILGFGGRVEAIRQGAVDASFGIVLTDETARRGLNAALAIQRSLVQQADQGPGGPSSCVLALHTAQFLLARIAGKVQLDEVEKGLAASVLDELVEAAPPGAIVVSVELVPFLHRHFELAPQLARHGTRPVYRIVRHDASGVGAWRQLSPFVGRDYEYALLKQRWEDASKGRGQFVDIVGNPGVGKSRLLWELAQYCRVSGQVVTMVGAPTETASPYFAMGEALQRLLPPDAGDQTPAERVTTLLERLGMAPSVSAPILQLLGRPSDEWLRLDLGQRRRQILTAVRGILKALSVLSPLALLIDDAQWLDPESLNVIEGMIDDLPSERIMLIVAHRPDTTTSWPRRSHGIELRLGPISDEDTRQLLDALIGRDESVVSLKQQIAVWTAGNAFFLEESVRTLVEGAVLSGDRGAYRLDKPIERLEVPPTVEGVLDERIDRLSAVERNVLQSMSVAGAEVELATLMKLIDLDKDVLHKTLARLCAAEFIHQNHVVPDRTFAFKHGLTHEVAYQRVTPDLRRALHARLVTIGEELFAGHVDEKADWLAFHALRGEAWDRTVVYLRLAAGRAIARASNRLAIQHLENALSTVDHLPVSDERTKLSIDLRIDLRHAMTPLGRVERTLDHLRAAEALAIELDDPSRLGRIVSFISSCLILQGRYQEALVTGERALGIARELADHPLEIATQIYMGRARMSRGEYVQSAELLREVIRSLEERPLDDFLGLPNLPRAVAGGCLALILADLGDFEEAEAHGGEAARRADASKQPDSIVWAYRGLGGVALARGDAQEAVRIFESLLEVSRAHDLDTYVSRIMTGLGLARVRLGQVDEGRALLERAVTLDRTAESRTTHTAALIALAEAHWRAGDLVAATAAADEAVHRSRLYGERAAEGYARLALAMAQSAGTAASEVAEDTFRAAAAIAAELHMRPLLAHCWLGLADVGAQRDDSGRHPEFRERSLQLMQTLRMQPWFPTRGEREERPG